MSKLISNEELVFTQGTVVDNVRWGLDPCPLGIILSNPCDLEHEKASFILIAALLPATEILTNSVEYKSKIGDPDKGTLSKNKWENLKKYLSSYVHNANVTRYFFIDPNPAFTSPLLFVDFQLVTSVPISDKEGLQIIGRLPSPYVEKMIMHFSSYVSRIGVDRVEDPELERICRELIVPLTAP
jgi:hypothetical protein